MTSTIKKITITGSTPTEGQVLSADASGNLTWSNQNTDASTWSQNNATQAVNLNNNDIQNVNKITTYGNVFGTNGQLLSSNGTKCVWVDAPVSASNWSQYSASQNVLLNSYNLSGVKHISSGWGGIYGTPNQVMSVGYHMSQNYIEWVNRVCGAYDIYVAGNGSDGYAGTPENPYATIGKAIQVAENAVDGLPRFIHIAGGVYTETLTITKKVHLIGYGNCESTGAKINGTITMSLTSTGDLANNGVHLENLCLTKVVNSSSGDAFLNLVNCRVESSADDNLLSWSPTGSNKLILNKCVFNSTHTTTIAPALNIASGSLIKMKNTDVLVSGLNSCVSFGANSTCEKVVDCNFISQTADANAEPIVKILSTQSTEFVFYKCSFEYTSSTSKTNTNVSAIYDNGTTHTLKFMHCYTNLLGYVSGGVNYAIRNPNSITIYNASSYSIPTLANLIQGNNTSMQIIT